jgi:hypothetical protein
VNLREVREVRDGRNSRDFDRWPEEARRYDPSLCFVIFYGNDFKLKTLSVVGKFCPQEEIESMKKVFSVNFYIPLYMLLIFTCLEVVKISLDSK